MIKGQKRSKFREISVSRVIPAGIGPIHGYFRDMTAFKKGHAPCFLVLWRFWVLITLTSTLNPICPVLRYPCEKQFFSTEYPSNEIYFPDKKPYSGDFQYKKSHFGKKWPKIDQNCEKKRGFYHCKHSFSPEWSISINKIPL